MNIMPMDQSQDNILVDKDDSQQNNIQVFSQEFSFSGPLPPPQVLAQYEKILPGSAEKIMDNAARQSQHRMDLENKVVHSDVSNSRLGLIFGLIMGLAGFTAAVLVARFGKETASSIIGGGTLVALVGSFIYGSRGKNIEK